MTDEEDRIEDLPQFFETLRQALEDTGEDLAVVTIIMPDGQLCDFEISYLGEHDPDADYTGGEPIWKDDTQG